MPRHLATQAGKHLLLAAIGLLLGLLYGAPLAGLVAALVIALTWHLYQLTRLYDWLSGRRSKPLPAGFGLWASTAARVMRLREEKLLNRTRYNRLAEEWREITDALPDASLLLNESFEVMQLNRKASELLNISTAELYGQRVTNMLRNPDFVAMLEKGDFSQRLRISAPLDDDRALICIVTPYGANHHLLTLRDISERIRSDLMKTEFVGNASHELRTPLTVLHGYLSAMDEAPELDADWRDPIDEMNVQVERMQALVADLLTLNLIESSGAAPLDRRVDMSALLRQACKDAQVMAAQTPAINLKLDSDAELAGDARLLASVASNLLSNAVRFTPADDRIEARWYRDTGGACLSVSDNGIGMSVEDTWRVTERFYRTDPGRARHQGGTGLGLAIVKHALAVHDATLEIDSEPGAGSCFYCHFPASRLLASDTRNSAQSG